MSEAYKTWAPTKPADSYLDDEIRETPLFDKIRENFVVAGSSGEVILPESSILRLARDAIKEMWSTLVVTQFSDVIVSVFDTLEEAGIDHGNELTIKLDPERRIGSYDRPKGQGRKRFGHTQYAEFVGMGTPKDSPLYRECVQALKDKCGLDESVLQGGFLLHKTQMRTEMRNGIFELVLKKGIPGNKVTDAFSVTLRQFPFVEQSVQEISFPPVSGDKNQLIQTDTVKEVPSMSQMLKQSILESQQTPAVMFGLVDLLKEQDDEDGTDKDDSTEAKKVDATPAAAPASAARALLDDDDEE